MNWNEAYIKFAEWHAKSCKYTGMLALNGIGGCYPSGVQIIAELKCETCKDTFHIKYKTG